jgi:RimJ/RimL family protein N-acetyltransferase
MNAQEIQTLTASEPLSLQEEYDMQKSWRTDGDKLTFIICSPLSEVITSSNGQDVRNTPLSVGEHDGECDMVGDVNLFLSPPDDDDEEGPVQGQNHQRGSICTGELELMIASPRHRRRGYGRASILAFVRYISLHLEQILVEFQGSSDVKSETTLKGMRLRVKIGGENSGSIALFEGLGFEKVGEVNYFGEVELRRRGILEVRDEGQGNANEISSLIEGYKELEYDDRAA